MPFSEALKQYNYAMDRGQRQRFQEQQAERQHSMDLFQIQRAREQDTRAAQDHEWRGEQYERSAQTHNETLEAQRLTNESNRTILNTEAYKQIGQAFSRMYDPETREYRSDPQAVEEFSHSLNLGLKQNERLNAKFGELISQFTDGKYNNMSVAQVGRRGENQFAIEFHNPETGENGVMTENASTDPDDNVLILTGEQLHNFYRMGSEIVSAQIPEQVFTHLFGGKSRQFSPLVDAAEPQQVVSTLEQIYAQEPDIEPEQAIELAETLLLEEEPEGEEQASVSTPLSNATSTPADPVDLRNVPAAMRGIHQREQRLNEKLGTPPMREQHAVNSPAQEAQGAESSLRPGQRHHEAISGAINERAQRNRERPDSRLAADRVNMPKSGFDLPQYVSDLFGWSKKESGAEPVAAMVSNSSAPPARIPSVDSENFSQDLQQEAERLAMGDTRPNATHRRQAQRAMENPREASQQERATAAFYLLGSGFLTHNEAERFAKTGTVDPTTLTFEAGQADAHQRLVQTQNDNNRKLFDEALTGFGKSLDAVNDLADSVFKGLHHKDFGITEQMYPNARGIVSSVISQLFTESAFGNREPRDVQEAIEARIQSARFAQDVNSPMMRGVMTSAFAETHRQVSEAKKGNKPDFETLLLNNVVRRMNRLESLGAEGATPQEVELMRRYSETVGRDITLLSRGYQRLNELNQERGIGRITLDDLLEGLGSQ